MAAGSLARAAACTLLLSACATAPVKPAGDAELEARTTTWRGRFAYAFEARDGVEPRRDSGTGGFVLRAVRAPQAPRMPPPGVESLSLELYSPLGQTVAVASSDASGASIRLADGRRLEAADPEALTEQAFGWRMPIGRLADWLDGRSGDGPAERDPTGRLLRAVDGNWRVTVVEWGEDGPTRIDLDWPVQPVVPPRTLRLRLAVEPPARGR